MVEPERAEAAVVWQALAEPVRRGMLEHLLTSDGATLSGLARVSGVSRSTASKHVATLERAGLIRSERVGRERRHWLQVGPLASLRRGWLRPFLSRWAETMDGVRQARAMQGARDRYVLQVHIRCSAGDVWSALTEGRVTRRWLFGLELMSSWLPVSGVLGLDGSGMPRAWGEVLRSEPLRLLSMTWQVSNEDGEPEAEVSRVTLRIDEGHGRCLVTLRHDEVGPRWMYAQSLEGWRAALDSLKSLLETGWSLSEPLPRQRTKATVAERRLLARIRRWRGDVAWGL